MAESGSEEDWEALADDIDDSVLASKPVTEEIKFTQENIQWPGAPTDTIDVQQMASTHFSTRKDEETKTPVPKAPRAPKEKPRQELPPPINKEELIANTRVADAKLKLGEPDGRDTVNFLIIGHVDSGKSTLCGRILLALQQVDERLVKQYEEEAIENGRNSWWLAYIMDTNEEERTKGKTIELGKAYFTLESKRYVLLDAPGHLRYIANMILGTAQADVVAIVISAKLGEFEAGFDRGGQTAEHALIAKARGVQQFIVVVTKMDEVGWDHSRFVEIQTKFSAFLEETCKITGAQFIPISGLAGTNILETAEGWYTGPALLPHLNSLQLSDRHPYEPLVIPVLDSYKDQGIMIQGKIERGIAVRGLKVLVLPIEAEAEVLEVYGFQEQRMLYATVGDNVRLKLRVPETVNIRQGYVIYDINQPYSLATAFEADVALMDLLPKSPIFAAGYFCILHIHTLVEQVTVSEVLGLYDPERRKLVTAKFGKSHSRLRVKFQLSNSAFIPSKELEKLGHFILRDEHCTIGVGRVRQLFV